MDKKDFKGMNYDNFDRFLINFMGVNNSLPTAGDESLSHMEVLYKCYHKILECMKAVDCLNKNFQLLKDFVIEKLKAMEERLQEIENRQDDLETLVNSFELRISALENFVENILTNEELFETIANYLTNNVEFVESLVNNETFINNLVENLTINETFITEIVNENFINEIFNNAEYVTDLTSFIENYLSANPQGDKVVGGRYIDVDENSEGEKVLNSTGRAEFLQARDGELKLKLKQLDTRDVVTISDSSKKDFLGVRRNLSTNTVSFYGYSGLDAFSFWMGLNLIVPQTDTLGGWDNNKWLCVGQNNEVRYLTGFYKNHVEKLILLGADNHVEIVHFSPYERSILAMGFNNNIKNVGLLFTVLGTNNNWSSSSLSSSNYDSRVTIYGSSNSKAIAKRTERVNVYGTENELLNNSESSVERLSMFGHGLQVMNSRETAFGMFNKTKESQKYSYGIGDETERKNLLEGDGSTTKFYTNCNFTEGLQVNGVNISPSETDVAKQFRTMYSTGTENSISEVTYRKVLEKTIPKSDIAEGFYHNFYTSVRINRINSSTHDGSTFGDDYGFCDLTLATNLPSSSSATPNYYGQIILENKKGDTSEYNLADNLKLIITEVNNIYKVTLYIKGYKNHLGIITNDELYRTPTGNEPIHWNNFTEQVLAEQPKTLPTGLAVKETDLT